MKQQVNVIPGVSQEQMITNFGRILSVPYGKETFTSEKTKGVIHACVRRGHESVLEHQSVTLDCLTNIATYKDYTRHRHASFTIESTSFVNYLGQGKQLPMIVNDTESPIDWALSLSKFLDDLDLPPKIARDYLPQGLAARMIMSANLRTWRYIIGLRGDPNDNPLTIELRNKMWFALSKEYPFFFPWRPEENDPMAIRDEWYRKGSQARVSTTPEGEW